MTAEEEEELEQHEQQQLELDEDRCCVCLARQRRPVRSKHCGHGMCARCAISHAWQSRQAGAVHCPLCRGRLRSLASPMPEDDDAAASARRRIRVEFAGIQWDIELARGESAKDALVHLFQIPAARLKVIKKGGQVVTDISELVVDAADDTRRRYRLVGTPASDAQLWDIWRRETGERAQAWVEWVLALIAQLLELVQAFFVSMLPSSNPRGDYERQRRSRERERHRREHQQA